MSSPLRKPAILIASLDRASAAKLLAQMPQDVAKRVLVAAKQLGKIDPGEQQAVMREFLAQKEGKDSSSAKQVSTTGDDVELSLSLDAPNSGFQYSKPELAESSNSPKKSEAITTSSAPERFAFVTDEDVRPLAVILHREHPRLAALMLAHLPAERSAAVLAQLAAPLRMTIVERIADIEYASAEVLTELEQELKTQLMRERLKVSGSKHGLATLSGILQASDPQLRDQISAAMEARRQESKVAAPPAPGKPVVPAVAEHAEPNSLPLKGDEEITSQKYLARKVEVDLNPIAPAPLLAFSGLGSLDDISLAAVFGSVTPQIALLALVGADESLVRRILKVLPRKEAAHFRKRLDEVGPLRLKEVEQAQSRLSDAAGELIQQRRISLPIPHRARVAA